MRRFGESPLQRRAALELTPSNIMPTKSRAKLMDLGLANAPVVAVGAGRARIRYRGCCSADRRRNDRGDFPIDVSRAGGGERS
jgi:hypothetical protein